MYTKWLFMFSSISVIFTSYFRIFFLSFRFSWYMCSRPNKSSSQPFRDTPRRYTRFVCRWFWRLYMYSSRVRRNYSLGYDSLDLPVAIQSDSSES
jgi:hypothetical protein